MAPSRGRAPFHRSQAYIEAPDAKKMPALVAVTALTAPSPNALTAPQRK